MENAPMHKVSSNLLLVLYYSFKALPIAISGFSIYLGYRLFILGVTGEASLSVEAKSVSGQLLNAAPGLFFATGGIVALIASAWKGIDIKFRDDESILSFKKKKKKKKPKHKQKKILTKSIREEIKPEQNEVEQGVCHNAAKPTS
jgi:hypothetical protein